MLVLAFLLLQRLRTAAFLKLHLLGVLRVHHARSLVHSVAYHLQSSDEVEHGVDEDDSAECVDIEVVVSNVGRFVLEEIVECEKGRLPQNVNDPFQNGVLVVAFPKMQEGADDEGDHDQLQVGIVLVVDVAGD